MLKNLKRNLLLWNLKIHHLWIMILSCHDFLISLLPATQFTIKFDELLINTKKGQFKQPISCIVAFSNEIIKPIRIDLFKRLIGLRIRYELGLFVKAEEIPRLLLKKSSGRIWEVNLHDLVRFTQLLEAERHRSG